MARVAELARLGVDDGVWRVLGGVQHRIWYILKYDRTHDNRPGAGATTSRVEVGLCLYGAYVQATSVGLVYSCTVRCSVP